MIDLMWFQQVGYIIQPLYKVSIKGLQELVILSTNIPSQQCAAALFCSEIKGGHPKCPALGTVGMNSLVNTHIGFKHVASKILAEEHDDSQKPVISANHPLVKSPKARVRLRLTLTVPI